MVTSVPPAVQCVREPTGLVPSGSHVVRLQAPKTLHEFGVEQFDLSWRPTYKEPATLHSLPPPDSATTPPQVRWNTGSLTWTSPIPWGNNPPWQQHRLPLPPRRFLLSSFANSQLVPLDSSKIRAPEAAYLNLRLLTPRSSSAILCLISAIRVA